MKLHDSGTMKISEQNCIEAIFIMKSDTTNYYCLSKRVGQLPEFVLYCAGYRNKTTHLTLWSCPAGTIVMKVYCTDKKRVSELWSSYPGCKNFGLLTLDILLLCVSQLVFWWHYQHTVGIIIRHYGYIGRQLILITKGTLEGQRSKVELWPCGVKPHLWDQWALQHLHFIAYVVATSICLHLYCFIQITSTGPGIQWGIYLTSALTKS